MKPDWKDAPEWANWLAMDEDGEWYWYEYEPSSETRTWFAYGKQEKCNIFYGWKESKEQRS